jgi:hypothetical protein
VLAQTRMARPKASGSSSPPAATGTAFSPIADVSELTLRPPLGPCLELSGLLEAPLYSDDAAIPPTREKRKGS